MKVGCLIRFADDSYCAPSVRGKIGIVTDVSGQFEGLWRPYERWRIDVLVDGRQGWVYADELERIE